MKLYAFSVISFASHGGHAFYGGVTKANSEKEVEDKLRHNCLLEDEDGTTWTPPTILVTEAKEENCVDL